ncbi:hypothetical protein QTP88_026604 [Uroleucon formosanum]
MGIQVATATAFYTTFRAESHIIAIDRTEACYIPVVASAAVVTVGQSGELQHRVGGCGGGGAASLYKYLGGNLSASCSLLCVRVCVCVASQPVPPYTHIIYTRTQTRTVARERDGLASSGGYDDDDHDDRTRNRLTAAVRRVIDDDDGCAPTAAAAVDRVAGEDARMKPITFENLRRLIGGRRKNKDRNESPFKRSDSFKRISIRRNYLDGRGGGQKGRNPTKKPPPIDGIAGGDDSPPQHSSVLTSAKPDGSLPTSPPVVSRLQASPRAVSRRPLSPLPAPPCEGVVPPPPVERRRQAVAPAPPPPPPPSPPPTGSTTAATTTTTGSSAPAVAAPVIDYGEWIRCIRAEEDLNNLKRSCSPPPPPTPPTPPARYRYHVHKELDDSSRTDSAISLGRIWMDAPMLPPAAPRSLELPARPAATAAMAADGDGQAGRPTSAVQAVPSVPYGRDGVNKTASRSSVASTCSGKDSGFSLSAPGLSDPPRPSKQQLFRKKVPRRPAAGVAAKPTTAALRLPPTPQDQLYQVVVARSPFRQLKLDPMMFVPPEKRRPTQHHHHHHHHTKPRPVVEIRDYCVPKDARLQRRDPAADYRGDTDDYDDEDDEQDRLYESISKGSRGRWQESTDDADTEDDEQEQLQQLYHRRHQQHHHYQHQNHDQHRTPTAVARNTNRVKRKKSARRNIKYVVKPVRRAPSAATRRPSVTARSKSAGTPLSKLTVREVANEVGISICTCHLILSDALGMKRVSAKLVPKLLTEEQMEHCIEVCLDLKNRVSNDPCFIKSIITSDETWVYGYDPETKVQSSQWKTANSPRPKKCRQVRSNIKAMLIVFFDFFGLVHYEFAPTGQTINQVFYKQVLERLREKVRRKRPEAWKSKSWFLHHDNAPAHSALSVREFLTSKNIPVVPHPPYSPDLASCDFFLLPRLKSTLKGHRFEDVNETIHNATQELKAISIEKIQRCFKK